MKQTNEVSKPFCPQLIYELGRVLKLLVFQSLFVFPSACSLWPLVRPILNIKIVNI